MERLYCTKLIIFVIHGERRRLVKISLKAMLHVVGRRSPYSLILSIGDIYMFVITWMHIEKNVCESLIGTLLNIQGKTKDGLNTRLDLMEMGLRSELAPRFEQKQTYLPPACYTLSRIEKKIFCQTLANLKVLEGCYSNFRNLVYVEEFKIVGLKSHGYHTLKQQLLPIELRSILPKHV